MDNVNAISPVAGSIITFFRAVRLVRVFRMLPAFELTLRSVVEILPVLAQYIAVLLGGLYFFAIVGEY